MNRIRKTTLGLIASGALVTAPLMFTGASATSSVALTAYTCGGSSADGTTITSDLAGLQQGGSLVLSGLCGSASAKLNIVVPQGVTLEGTEGSDDGVSTEIYGNVSDTNGESVTIHGLQVNCEGSGNGISLDGWQNTVTNVTVTGCVNGIVLNNPANGNGTNVNDRIDNNFIQNTSAYGFYVDDSGNGITDGHFEGNYVANGTVSVYLTNSAGWYIANNHTYSQSGVAIYASRMWGTHITGNYIENWTTYGIEGAVQAGAVASTVTGNDVFENDGGTVGSGGNAGAGIYITPNGSPSYVDITGNTVIGTDNASGSYGIEGYGSGLIFVSSGNLVAGVAHTSAAVSGAVKSTGV